MEVRLQYGKLNRNSLLLVLKGPRYLQAQAKIQILLLYVLYCLSLLDVAW